MSIAKFQARMVLRAIVSVLILGAATTELAQADAVMQGLALMGYPSWLVWLLGPAKLCAVVALWFGSSRLRMMAWAGLWFNLLGATASLLLAGQLIMPDVILAPLYWALISAGAWLEWFAQATRPLQTRALLSH